MHASQNPALRRAPQARIILLVGLLAIVVPGCIRAADLAGRVYTDLDWRFTFGATKFEWDTFDHKTQEYNHYATFPYRLVERNKVPFIEYGPDYSKRWLALYNQHLLILLNSSTSPLCFFFGMAKIAKGLELHHPVSDAVVSSQLTQDGITYAGENLGVVGSSRPWVEGVHGQGIGQTIKLYRPVSRFPGQPTMAAALIWSSGFVSYDKPWLYELNSRPKILRISGAGHKLTVLLPDSPNPYLIKVPDNFGTDLTITIAAVYPGSKWEDTCVNFLMLRLY